MKLKPFVNINFCYKCGCPVPRVGISIKTGFGNVSTTNKFVCPKCKKKRKQLTWYIGLEVYFVSMSLYMYIQIVYIFVICARNVVG